ncbi:MAG: hypothetical protein CBC48_01165 [bacterium TMED88]|nr:MAG: hypothetical protein CBC48_01165 [bacterium TMED88]
MIAPAAGAEGDLTAVQRGQRVFESAGGCTCHTNYPEEGTDAPWLAGGRGLSTPFGVYYSSNITPDPTTGLGGFSQDDFLRAMQEGLSPEGHNYFPIFPYTAFTKMSDSDLEDLYAFLKTVPAIERSNQAPDAPPPFSWRWTITAWKWLNFKPGRQVPDPTQSAAWNRGAYLVNGPGHCGECHTPRTLSGGLDRGLWLAGSAEGPEGELAPNITPDDETGIGDWSTADLVWYLETGFKPDGDDTQGLMAELIEHGFSDLSRSDRGAIAQYLKSVPAIQNQVQGGSGQ